MGSDESHFNVSLIVRDKVTRLCPQTTTFLKKKESRSGIEPRPFCFKPAHKPSSRQPLVIPRDNSGEGAGLWMGPKSAQTFRRALTASVNMLHADKDRVPLQWKSLEEGHLRCAECGGRSLFLRICPPTLCEPVWPRGKAFRLVSGRTSVRYRFGSPFSSKRL